MDLQVTQENLSKALQSVVRIASSRSTLPILSNILLKTVENRLQLSATNLDIATTHFIGAKIKKEGSITIPAKLISDFVSSLPSGNIDIKQTDNKITIKSPQYNSVINGVLADDFPVMPEIKNGDKWSIDSLTMKKLFNKLFLPPPTMNQDLFLLVFLYIVPVESFFLPQPIAIDLRRKV